MGKYFKYAIGEIALVMIGILLALQVSNWNEKRKNNSSRNQLVGALLVEFETNYQQLERVINQDSLNLEICKTLQGLIKAPKESIKVNELQKLFTDISNFTFDPANGVLKSGISSGVVHYIENEKLKELLFAWEDVIKDAKEEEDLYRDHYFNKMHPFIEEYTQTADHFVDHSEYISISKFKTDYYALLNNRQFENLTSMRTLLLLDALGELKPIRKTNEDIIKLLNDELLND